MLFVHWTVGEIPSINIPSGLASLSPQQTMGKYRVVTWMEGCARSAVLCSPHHWAPSPGWLKCHSQTSAWCPRVPGMSVGPLSLSPVSIIQSQQIPKTEKSKTTSKWQRVKQKKCGLLAIGSKRWDNDRVQYIFLHMFFLYLYFLCQPLLFSSFWSKLANVRPKTLNRLSLSLKVLMQLPEHNTKAKEPMKMYSQ